MFGYLPLRDHLSPVVQKLTACFELFATLCCQIQLMMTKSGREVTTDHCFQSNSDKRQYLIPGQSV
ncbi:hypothetical protein NG43_01940 [Winslowiella iniecta]|uniref:Uncharacterized protein n=1 Tax=Winslowiella iniecta TaxID=1560201 RepID=A0A0L7TI11_9GAMM|nr:hypothetical protein NG43_01940 [Winslowiella iniecta]